MEVHCPAEMHLNGKFSCWSHEMSEMLNTFFASAFTEEDKIFFQGLISCFVEKIVKNDAHFSLLLIWLNLNSEN